MSTGARELLLPHLGRIEGHGGIHMTIDGNAVRDVDMDVFEGSRYYEKLLVGKRYQEVQGIITRVCAICSATHTVAALGALEQALGIPVSRSVLQLRELLLLGSIIESHALHVFVLALPDFLGFDSVMAMAAGYAEEVTFALRLKQLGNRIQELVGGRAVHPVNTLVGGFGKLPAAAELRSVCEELEGMLDPLMRLVDLAAGIRLPGRSAPGTVYVALRPAEADYRFCGEEIGTSRGETFPVARYRDVVREFTVEHSHAKHAALASGDSYMVGSLARLKLRGDGLEGRAREAFEHLFPSGVEDNILLNNWAQIVELVHCVERAMAHCRILAERPQVHREPADFEVRAGRGIAAVEAPRGTLFHEYSLDDEGRVKGANIVTPTAQNLANCERDLRAAAESLLAEEPAVTDAVLGRRLEMVTRAYDPCISCSVHVTRLDGGGPP